MISGRPIFLYAPIDLALSEYLQQHKSAYLVDPLKSLKDNILFFVENEELRKEIADYAVNRASHFHSTEYVHARISKLITELF